MAYSFLLTGWYANVRQLLGGNVDSQFPDATLDLDIYGPAAEDTIKRMAPDWVNDLLVPDAPKWFNRAATYLVASRCCSAVATSDKQSETIGADYRYTKADFDWEALGLKLYALFLEMLNIASPGAVEDMPYMDKITHTPPLYEELEIE